MKTKLYYVVEKQTQLFDDVIEETIGFKDIRVYEILDGDLKEILSIETRNDNISREVIIDQILEQGKEPEDFELIQL